MPRNLSKEINQYLSPEARDLVGKVTRAALNQGQRPYLVGGVVRDLMLGKPSLDLDFSTEGDALALAAALGEEIGQRVTKYTQFGTATLSLNGVQVDIATARTETYSRPGALPQVKPATLPEDLRRRDFTVNAMALDISPSGFGDLIDPLGGEKDLDGRLIRVMHEKSFADDPTRIFRAIRYEQRLAFSIEQRTLEWLSRDRKFIVSLSGERVRHEIELMFREERPEKSLQRGEELGIWKLLDPALKGDDNLEAAFERLRTLDTKTPYPLSLLFSLFFFPIRKNEMEDLIERLDMPKAVATVLRDIVKLKGIEARLEVASKDRLAFYQTLSGFSPHAILVLAIYCQNYSLKEALFHYYDKLRLVRTALKGKDLLDMGFTAGPSVGRALQKLLEARITGEVKSRKDETEFVKKYL